MISINGVCTEKSYSRAYLAPLTGQYSWECSTWGAGSMKRLHTGWGKTNYPSFMKAMENFWPTASWWFFAHLWLVSTHSFQPQNLVDPSTDFPSLLTLSPHPNWSVTFYLSLSLSVSLPLSKSFLSSALLHTLIFLNVDSVSSTQWAPKTCLGPPAPHGWLETTSWQ